MTKRLFLCTDLDRTLLPNGSAPESVNARRLFKSFTARNDVILAYVTGRHLELLEEAVESYQVPFPDYAITDVGSKIHFHRNESWILQKDWINKIAEDWRGKTAFDLIPLFEDLEELTLQEPERQSDYKLSYFLARSLTEERLFSELESRLADEGIRANLTRSVDEVEGIGLLDILPRSAGKLGAIDFLRKSKGFAISETLFCGDSGNDLSVLTSPIPSVLVANASQEVRDQATEILRNKSYRDTLYLARGGLLGMNGNYSAGIIEGIVHYHKEMLNWFQDGCEDQG
jgi:sucrose-6F-phosphate phosphohydrolase